MSHNTHSNEDIYQPGGKSAYFLLSLLCLAFLLDYADRFILSALLPFIKQDWQLTDQSLGALTGILAIPMALLALPFSVIIDRWSRKKMIALSVFFWSLSTLACAFAQNYEQLLIFRALTGVGEAGYAPAAVAAIAAAFTWKQRAKITGIWDAFAPFGAAVGFAIGGMIGATYGWRHAFGIMGAPGILLAFLFLFTRDYKTVPLDGTQKDPATKPSLMKAAKQLFYTPSLRFVWIGFTFNFAVNTAAMAWMPSFFVRFQGMDEETAGKVAGILALMALIGAPLGGFLADYWMKSRENARLVVCSIASFISALFFLLAMIAGHGFLFWIFIVGFGISSVAFLAPGAATIQDVVHPGLRAIAYGFNVTFLNLFGASWAPGFIGYLSDSWGLDMALRFLPVLGLVSAIAFYRGAAYYTRDIRTVKKVTIYSE